MLKRWRMQVSYGCDSLSRETSVAACERSLLSILVSGSPKYNKKTGWNKSYINEKLRQSIEQKERNKKERNGCWRFLLPRAWRNNTYCCLLKARALEMLFAAYDVWYAARCAWLNAVFLRAPLELRLFSRAKPRALLTQNIYCLLDIAHQCTNWDVSGGIVAHRFLCTPGCASGLASLSIRIDFLRWSVPCCPCSQNVERCSCCAFAWFLRIRCCVCSVYTRRVHLKILRKAMQWTPGARCFIFIFKGACAKYKSGQGTNTSLQLSQGFVFELRASAGSLTLSI